MPKAEMQNLQRVVKKPNPNRSHFRKHVYELHHGKRVIAVCTDRATAEFLSNLTVGEKR